MTDKRTDEIRGRLEKATPGPWRVGYDDGSGTPDDDYGPFTIQTLAGEFVTDAMSGEVDMRDYAYGVLDPDDAILIANAPADIAYLLERIEALEAEIGR